MNTPSPLIPKGSLLEQTAKGKPHLRVACIIVAIHMVFLGGLLIQGCKKEDLNAKANPGVDSTRLKVGQKLVVPAPASATIATAAAGNSSENSYVVKTGDTLHKIARANGTSVNEIKALNGLKTDRIKVGDKLKLPASKPAPVTATPGGPGNL